MSGFGKRISWPGDRRTSERRPVFVVGSAVTIQGSKSVLVEDLSSSGARLIAMELPPVGRQMLVWVEGFDVLGKVAWTKFGEGGVSFETPLDGLTLAGLEERSVNSVSSS